MPVQNFNGDTFVAFTDISGFKELMKNDTHALTALKYFYQAGYDALHEDPAIQGFFISDCGILFSSAGEIVDRLQHILTALKFINKAMLRRGYMLTTSIAYGNFDYHDKLEFDGIEKNPIYGYAYVQAFLDNETGNPKIEPGLCRVVTRNLPPVITARLHEFPLLKKRGNDKDHLYYYWNTSHPDHIEAFEAEYNDSYKQKYSGMLKALKTDWPNEDI